jgi:transcriptional regulator with XRE-family HTH domain
MPSASIELGRLPEWAELGKQLGRARRMRGLTQKELADRCKLRQGEISAFESSRRQPTLAQLTELARSLDVPMQWFISGGVRPPEEGMPHLVVELRHWGIYDLATEGALVPGAFRPLELLLAQTLRGDVFSKKLIESIPYLLATAPWRSRLVLAYGREVGDPRVLTRLGWLADVTRTLHKTGQLTEAQERRGALFTLVKKTTKSSKPDGLGHPATDWSGIPPVYKRWNITYAGTLDQFHQRVEQLRQLRPVREA